MNSVREALRTEFLRRHGWHYGSQKRLPGDASFRSYDRLEHQGRTAILMDAPPPRENVRSWVVVARHLSNLGFSAPTILAEDLDAGLLLIEDLGDNTYAHLLARGEDEDRLYTLAVDTLIALHRMPEVEAVPPELARYSTTRLLDEVNRLLVWYLPLASSVPVTDYAKAEYEAVWRHILPAAWDVPSSLILFDYHVGNLLGLFDRAGVRACGLLDFQDAVAGPVTYDVMSLLEDARRDIDPALVQRMKLRYRAAFPQLDERFDCSWAVMAAQRHLRVLGTFARLKVRDGKPQYLSDVPRVWRYLDACLTHTKLAPLREWMDRYIPAAARDIPWRSS